MQGRLVVDERKDVFVSLEHCIMSLSQAQDSDGEWKWVILSLHSAFQGSMVCHLSGSELLGAWRNKKDAEKWLEWKIKNRDRRVFYEENMLSEIKRIQNGDDEYIFPKRDIASSAELFERLGSLEKRIEKNGVGGVISINSQQEKSFKQFNFLRDKFTHFSPKIWGISFDFIIDPMKDVLDIFEKIIADPYTFRPGEKKVLCSKIEKIRSFL